MKKVVIVQKATPEHYRIDFYNLLKKELEKENISLELIYGDFADPSKKDYEEIPWGTFRKNKIIDIGRFKLIWQPVFDITKNADLVIVEQANKLLINYLFILRRIFSTKKFAFWGHGSNLQENPGSFLNTYKKFYTNKTDWWFAYTSGVKNRLLKNGYPESRITVVENSFDTKESSRCYNSITDEETNDLRKQYNLKSDDFVGIYCGAIYKEKRLDFLISAIDKIKIRNENFKFFIVGGGPDQDYVSDACKSRSWLYYVGPRFGKQKAMFFKVSRLFLIPGAIGLAALDSFTHQTPIATTTFKFHGPEFEYLKNGYNSLITEDNIDMYVEELCNLIRDERKIELLKENCIVSSGMYSIEKMVNNFKGGIVKCLK